MIGATYPVLALSRFRSEPQQISVSGRSRSCRKPRPQPLGASVFHSGSPSLHLPSRRSPALHSTRSAAKTHSIPRDSFRLRSMNSIRSAPARPFRRSTPSFRRSTSDRILFIIGGYSGESVNWPARGIADTSRLPGTNSRNSQHRRLQVKMDLATPQH